MKKKNLKNNKDNIFITKDLTKFRQSIIKELNTQKKAKTLNSFWTFDGRIFAKKDRRFQEDIHQMYPRY